MATLLASHWAAAAAAPSSALALAVTAAVTALGAWRERRRLARLDARQRRALGLGMTDGASVAVQPGWDVGLLGLR